MIRVIRNYTKIFKGIRLPWFLLFLVVALSFVKTHLEVEAITLTASIIDGTQNAVRTEELIRYIEFQVLSGVSLVAFTYISGLASVRLAEICTYFGSFAGNAGIVRKIGKILEAPDEVEEGCEMDVADADIHVKDVSFSYQARPVLKKVCCTIPKGKITAIVGTNGAGKSTLFKLLERMYQPTEGEICFDERNITDFNLTSWRKSLAIVTQEKPLLSGTIRENILYGVERTVTEEELVHVAKMANIYEFVCRLPEGFDAQCGPGGSNFSGGQQQCIAIARAMMRNPDYLLLDEATSNLDARSGQQVTEALNNLMKGRTTVLIAHNYSATIFADQVIVLCDGEVQACGSPEELLKTNDYYRTFAAAGCSGAGKEACVNEIKNDKLQ